ncbi:MAG: DUF255 domain-containing protein [Bacteroidales bacterium]
MFKTCSPYIKLLFEKDINWSLSLTPKLLDKAQREDKLIFLHIGYVSNIAIREASLALFSNKEVQTILNENFIAIVEDKNDRPESFLLALDLLFLNQDFSYGPMNIFIMPNRKPIIAFSDCDTEHFIELANSLLLAKSEKREKLEHLSDTLSERAIYTGVISNVESESEITHNILKKYLDIWFENMYINDFIYKLKPFTPNTSSLLTIIEYLYYNNDIKYLSTIENILDHLQFSALFDPIDGGFFEQATDYSCNHALYEKTLEVNSHFLLLYSIAYKLFGKESYSKTAYLTYNYIIYELSNKKSGLINATTITGKLEDVVYYLWSINELSILFPERYIEIAIALGMDVTLNKKKKQLPIRSEETYTVISKDELEMLKSRRKEHRGYFKDIRAISSSNAIAISSLARASIYLEDSSLYKRAIDIFEFILTNNIDKTDNRLYRYTCFKENYLTGYLSDYAHFIEASIELYKVEEQKEYLIMAEKYCDFVIEKFYKPSNGMFSKSEKEINRAMDTVPFKRESNIDIIKPSANSIMAGNLLSLYEITGNKRYLTIAVKQINNIVPNLLKSGPMLSSWAHKVLKLIYLNSGRGSK